MHEFKVSVAEIIGRPGAYRDLDIRKPLDGVRTSLARLQQAIEARLRAESVVEGILITGPVRGNSIFQCARCLKQLPSEITVDVCELFYAPGHSDQADADSYRVAGNEIDLEPMLRDAITLGLPLNPLCAEGCKGLCAHCGKDLNRGDCDCIEETGDPRWAALDELRERLAQ